MMWAIMAWAYQAEYNQKCEEVNKKLEKYIDLDWLDFRQSKIDEACKAKASWKDMPTCIKAIYTSGAMVLVLVCHAFWWASSLCFGSFAVTDDIKTLTWYGSDDALLQLPGLACLLLVLAGFVGLLVYRNWYRGETWEKERETRKELDKQEKDWKAEETESRKREGKENKGERQEEKENKEEVNNAIINEGKKPDEKVSLSDDTKKSGMVSQEWQQEGSVELGANDEFQFKIVVESDVGKTSAPENKKFKK